MQGSPSPVRPAFVQVPELSVSVRHVSELESSEPVSVLVFLVQDYSAGSPAALSFQRSVC